MIVETGHYALVLALALALVNSVRAGMGKHHGDRRLMAVAPPVALMGFGLVAYAYFALTYAHVVSDFSLVNVVENSHSAKPLDLQNHRRLGQSRRLDASVGAGSVAVRRGGRFVFALDAGGFPRQCAGRAILDRRRVSSVHSLDVEPLRAARRGAGGRQ